MKREEIERVRKKDHEDVVAVAVVIGARDPCVRMGDRLVVETDNTEVVGGWRNREEVCSGYC